MIYIAPWKKILVVAICALGFLYAAPNLMGEQSRSWVQENLPAWAPSKTVNLGLDLRGGAHLLYEVEVGVVFKERADGLVQDLRSALREDKIGYGRLSSIENGVRVKLRDKADGESVRKILRKTDPNLDIKSGADELTVEAVYNDVGLKQIFDQTLSQSIEIVRRRIDELGTTEPIIQRQGEDRILI